MATLLFYVLVVLVIGSKGISISTGGSRSAPKVVRTPRRPPSEREQRQRRRRAGTVVPRVTFQVTRCPPPPRFPSSYSLSSPLVHSPPPVLVLGPPPPAAPTEMATTGSK